MRLGRALGQYHNTALLFDTSWIVKYGQHDYGASTALIEIKEIFPTFLEEFGKNTKS